ncbi:hypothetical protein Bca4012_037041 [Brassica carinata]
MLRVSLNRNVFIPFTYFLIISSYKKIKTVDFPSNGTCFPSSSMSTSTEKSVSFHLQTLETSIKGLSRGGPQYCPASAQLASEKNSRSNLQTELNMLPHVADLGGVVIDLQGGSYKLGKPLRIYKNGFVWHDVSKDDVIFPIHGQEYILKGSRILDFDCFRRLNQSWSITDLNEYKVYKSSETTAESTCKLATDVSTQTDDHRRRKKPAKEKKGCSVNEITELSREETVLPPQLDSRPKTLETLLKAEGVLMLGLEDQESNRTVENLSSGKMAVLMQLLSCGAVSFKQCVPTLMTGHTGCAIERGARKYKLERAEKELRSFGRVNLEEDEYFSGSLIAESNK